MFNASDGAACAGRAIEIASGVDHQATVEGSAVAAAGEVVDHLKGMCSCDLGCDCSWQEASSQRQQRPTLRSSARHMLS
jgi:hypothetical protein